MKQRASAVKAAVTLGLGVAAVAGGILLAHSQAMPDKISFPEGFEKGVLYTTVNRADIKQFRELYASAEAVKSVREGRGIPSGTVLTLVQYSAVTDDKGVPLRDARGNYMKGKLVGYTVMEKRKGWGAAIPEDWRNGEWEYAVFTADKKPNAKANGNIKSLLCLPQAA